MYYFDKELCNKAVELIRKSKEFADIATDVRRIDVVLNFPTNFSSWDMQNLDNEIRNKYHEIEVFRRAAEGVKWKVSNSGNYMSSPIIQEREALKFDYYFLCALALLRSGEIADYIAFFDKEHIERE